MILANVYKKFLEGLSNVENVSIIFSIYKEVNFLFLLNSKGRR